MVKTERVLRYIISRKTVRVRDVAHYFGISWDAAKYHLSKLEKEDMVMREEGVYFYIGDLKEEDISLNREEPLDSKVLQLFEDGIPRKPIDVARTLKIKKTTARAIVNRLFNEGELKRLSTGYYVHKNYQIITTKVKHTEEGKTIPVQYVMPRFTFHGIKLEYRDDEYCKHNPNFCVDILGRSFLQRYRSPDRRKHPKNHSISQSIYIPLEGEQVLVSVAIHKHLIEIWIKNTEKPIGMEGFQELIGWLNGVFYPLTPEQWKLTQIGVNEDLKGLRIDGASSITLQQYRNMILRIYNKKGIGLRREFHIGTKREESIDLSKALELFRGYDSSGILEKIEELRKAQEELVREREENEKKLTTILTMQTELSNLILTHIQIYKEEKSQIMEYMQKLNETLMLLVKREEERKQVEPENSNKLEYIQ